MEEEKEEIGEGGKGHEKKWVWKEKEQGGRVMAKTERKDGVDDDDEEKYQRKAKSQNLFWSLQGYLVSTTSNYWAERQDSRVEGCSLFPLLSS